LTSRSEAILAYPLGRQLEAGTSALELGYIAPIIIEPMDVQRSGMARTDLSALAGAGRRRGAAVGRDFADRQRLTAVLGGGEGLGDVHGPGVGVLAGMVKGGHRED
jgi:hypothetical protein